MLTTPPLSGAPEDGASTPAPVSGNGGGRSSLPMSPHGTRDLSSREAAERLGVSTSTVRNLARSGELPHRRTAGNHRRFAQADVAALRVRRRTETPVDEATRAAVWHAAALAVLRDAERDLGDTSPLVERFRAAADALGAS